VPQVDIIINNRPYKVACEDGEQERLLHLGRYIDRRFRDLALAGGSGTDLHMMVLTCLVLADELFDAQSGIGLATAKDAEAIDMLTRRIEVLANLLQRA
jgi:cell division protein ZapA (FtsZ GTPase activity inhibitor)